MVKLRKKIKSMLPKFPMARQAVRAALRPQLNNPTYSENNLGSAGKLQSTIKNVASGTSSETFATGEKIKDLKTDKPTDKQTDAPPSDVTHFKTEQIWVKAEGDPNSPDYKQPRNIWQVDVIDEKGNIVTRSNMEQDEYTNFVNEKKEGFVQEEGEEYSPFFDQAKEAEGQRQEDINAITLAREQGVSTPEAGQTFFENPKPATWWDSLPTVLGKISIDMDASDVLDLIRPQARRNVSTVNELGMDMESYAKEKLLQQARDGTKSRIEVIEESKEMLIVAYEMKETLLRERDVTVTGKALDTIDNAMVRIETLIGYLELAEGRVMALPATKLDQGQAGVLGKFTGRGETQSYPQAG